MTQTQLAWLAGLLEGEGSFVHGPPSAPNSPRISVQMTDEDVVRRVSTLFGLRFVSKTTAKRNPAWKTAYSVLLKGRRAVALMIRLRPLMGERRRAQIDKAVIHYTPRGTGDNKRKLTARNVRAIRKKLAAGERLLHLAVQYGVSRPTLRSLRDRKTWKWV